MQQIIAQTKSVRYATTIDVSPTTQFVTTIATTLTSQDEGDNGYTQTITKAQ
jgi:hypothetical protein